MVISLMIYLFRLRGNRTAKEYTQGETFAFKLTMKILLLSPYTYKNLTDYLYCPSKLGVTKVHNVSIIQVLKYKNSTVLTFTYLLVYS